MTIYQIEISDDDAAVLVGDFPGTAGPIDAEAVSAVAGKVITRYRHFPQLVDDRHKAAMAFVRAEAVKAAASVSKDGTSLEYAAERLTSFILGGR